MMNLQEALQNRQTLLGTLIVSPSPVWPKAVAQLGLDFVFIDTEHIPLDRQPLSWMCQHYAALNLPPVVRIPAPDPYQASMVLDGGAAGVIAPYLECPQQVADLVGAVKFKPLKGERLLNTLTARNGLEAELDNYVKQANRGRAVIANLESKPALDALDELLAVAGLDAVLIGPHDLSCSLGVPEQYTHPRFVAAVETIIGKATDRGISAGIHMIYGNLNQLVDWQTKGLNLLIHSADILAFRAKMTEDLAFLRAQLSLNTTVGDEAINI